MFEKPQTGSFSHKEFLIALLGSAIVGALIGAPMSFLMEGGINNPQRVFQKYMERPETYVWVLPLVGFAWATIPTCAMTFLRHYVIPYIHRKTKKSRGILVGLSSVLIAWTAILGVHLFLKLFSITMIDHRSIGPIIAVSTLISITLGNMFHAFHLKAMRLKKMEMEREQLERQGLEGELMNLNMRIRPHFFFNALNTLASLIDRDRDEAQEFLADLADLFRMSFTHGHTGHYCQWAEEKALIEAYLRVQECRFEERLNWSIQVDAPPNAPFPAFLLQPLLENALEHGIGQQKNDGKVTLTGTFSQNQWHLTLMNTTGKEAQIKIRPDHALGAIQTRLRLMNGDINIEADSQKVTANLHWSQQQNKKQIRT